MSNIAAPGMLPQPFLGRAKRGADSYASPRPKRPGTVITNHGNQHSEHSHCVRTKYLLESVDDRSGDKMSKFHHNRIDHRQ